MQHCCSANEVDSFITVHFSIRNLRSWHLVRKLRSHYNYAALLMWETWSKQLHAHITSDFACWKKPYIRQESGMDAVSITKHQWATYVLSVCTCVCLSACDSGIQSVSTLKHWSLIWLSKCNLACQRTRDRISVRVNTDNWPGNMREIHSYG